MKTLSLRQVLVAGLMVASFPVVADVNKPDFARYPATPVNATVKHPLSGANDQIRARVAYVKNNQEKPDFAGHYVVAAYGCGTGCMATALVDVKTGVVYRAPFNQPKEGQGSYRVDSKLIRFTDMQYERPGSPQMVAQDGLAVWNDEAKKFELLEKGKVYKLDM